MNENTNEPDFGWEWDDLTLDRDLHDSASHMHNSEIQQDGDAMIPPCNRRTRNDVASLVRFLDAEARQAAKVANVRIDNVTQLRQAHLDHRFDHLEPERPQRGAPAHPLNTKLCRINAILVCADLLAIKTIPLPGRVDSVRHYLIPDDLVIQVLKGIGAELIELAEVDQTTRCRELYERLDHLEATLWTIEEACEEAAFRIGVKLGFCGVRHPAFGPSFPKAPGPAREALAAAVLWQDCRDLFECTFDLLRATDCERVFAENEFEAARQAFQHDAELALRAVNSPAAHNHRPLALRLADVSANVFGLALGYEDMGHHELYRSVRNGDIVCNDDTAWVITLPWRCGVVEPFPFDEHWAASDQPAVQRLTDQHAYARFGALATSFGFDEPSDAIRALFRAAPSWTVPVDRELIEFLVLALIEFRRPISGSDEPH